MTIKNKFKTLRKLIFSHFKKVTSQANMLSTRTNWCPNSVQLSFIQLSLS